MPLEGRIAIDLGFTDTATGSDTVQSLKRISLVESTGVTTGKVALVTGTVSTAAVGLWSVNAGLQFGGYRDASGGVVTFASVSRVALQASGSSGAVIEDADLGVVELLSLSNRIAVADNVGNNLQIRTLAGTASFTAVLYGS